MFGKKKNHTVQPIEANEEVLIQISEPMEITKKTKITVPTQYKAIAYIDQKPLFRIDYCIEKEFVKTYDTDCIDDIIGDGEDFIDIPVVFKSKNSDVIRIGIVCVNLEASGEQHGAQFALSGGFYEDLDPRMTEELKAERKELGVYDYWYPFTYAGDIHTDFNDVPEAVQEMIDYAKGITEQNNTMEMSEQMAVSLCTTYTD